MSLKDKVLELQKKTPVLTEKKEEKWLTNIRKEYERMDSAFWMQKIDEMRVERCKYKDDPALLKLWIDKKIAMFERDEIRYRGYKQIMDNPEDRDRIMKQIKEQLEEQDKMLESIRGIEEGQQIRLDM